jgi:hypothetical protein
MQMMKRWFKRGLLLSAIAVCILSVPFTTAHAALVNYSFSFTGSLDSDPLGLFPISGSFQLNNAAGSSPGVYNEAVTSFTLNVGGVYTSTFTPGANAITISQNIALGGGNGDRWALVSAATGPQLTVGTPPVGYTPFSFDLRLDRIGGSLFSDTSLQDPPSFDALDNPKDVTGRWRLFFEDAQGNPAVYLGSINNIALTAVPLPAAVILFGAGLISLVGLGAGGLRNLRGAKA